MVQRKQPLHPSKYRIGFLIGAGVLLVWIGMVMNIQTAFTQSQTDEGAANHLFLPIIISNQSGSTKIIGAALQCMPDTGGANDPEGDGQKDLTQLCFDTTSPGNGAITTTWSWDESSLNGNNSFDACSLYDTDNDGNANNAVCLTVNTNNNTPTTQTSVYTWRRGGSDGTHQTR